MKLSRTTAAAIVSLAVSAPAMAQESEVENVILMVSDGIGFNGWLASDYYQGRAGEQPYQVTRPDGTEPVALGMAHASLNLVDEAGGVLESGSDPETAAGAVEQAYDPVARWYRFENAFLNDFPPIGEDYTSYTDSAASGSALHTGRKTANGRINMDWTGETPLRTIAQIAMDQGRSAGAVSTVQAAHATPASVIAHNVSRNNYAAIFNEMLQSDLDVIMGAGHPLYDASGDRLEPDPDDAEAFEYVGGPETWAQLTSDEGLNGFTFIDDVADFERLAAGEELPERVVGIARSNSTIQAQREGLAEGDTVSGMARRDDVPSLATMTAGALEILDRNPDGFYLMVEGGAVDWMGHANDMPRFIEEQIDFDEAVAAVIDWVETNSSWDETLLIVTSDHETGGIWGAETFRNGEGGPIAADRSDEAIEAARFDPREDRFVQFNAVQNLGAGRLPGYQWASGNHTNELVPLWALGAGAEAFHQFTRTDQKAAELWGEPYGWDGAFVDNTAVFHVMNDAFAGAVERETAAR
ncbi:MAG: alkaline phosphatase [Alphaproteobacteria bacterium]